MLKSKNVDQKTILKMDLHFSHKINPARPNELAQELKVLLEMHNIIPFYDPGACTDELQGGDLVIATFEEPESDLDD